MKLLNLSLNLLCTHLHSSSSLLISIKTTGHILLNNKTINIAATISDNSTSMTGTNSGSIAMIVQFHNTSV